MLQRIVMLLLFSTAVISFLFSGCNQDKTKTKVTTPTISDDQSKKPIKTTAVEPARLPVAKSERLELNLKVGNRFPMMKTIEQTLSQKTANGLKVSHSKLELLLAIEVKAVMKDGSKRLWVDYQRVKYSHELAGEHVQYDSSVPNRHVPQAAIVYQGLVGNGFSFWLGVNNKITKLENFEQFLKRCVRHAPVAQREQLLLKLTETVGDEGIANFIDDSIGLLPYFAEEKNKQTFVSVGDTWKRHKQVVRPLPMYYDTVYALRKINSKTATIDVTGTIRPSTTLQNTKSNKFSLTVRGGHSFGECTIDRNTGLPLESEITRYINMQVTPSVGKPFDQQKMIITKIRAFPQHSKKRIAIRPVTIRE